MRKLKILMLLGTTGILSSCDLSQIPGLDKRLNIEDSKAIGAACRHSGRALEDCFTLNPLALQSGVFEGWRDMNDYMVANKIETVEPVIQSSHYKPGAKEESAGDHGPPGATKAGGAGGLSGGVPGAAAGGVGGSSGGGSAGAWSPGGAQSPAGEATAGQGRPRWQPGQAGSGVGSGSSAAATAPNVAGTPSAGLAPPAQAGSPPAALEGSAAAPAPKSDSPARPWERKAGTKNTT